MSATSLVRGVALSSGRIVVINLIRGGDGMGNGLRSQRLGNRCKLVEIPVSLAYCELAIAVSLPRSQKACGLRHMHPGEQVRILCRIRVPVRQGTRDTSSWTRLTRSIAARASCLDP